MMSVSVCLSPVSAGADGRRDECSLQSTTDRRLWTVYGAMVDRESGIVARVPPALADTCLYTLPVAVARIHSCNMSCTSGFVDDVMFSYDGPCGGVTLPQQPRCNVVHGLTPLLRGTGCILS